MSRYQSGLQNLFPFARFMAVMFVAVNLAACASTPKSESNNETGAPARSASAADPLEGINRHIFAFNYRIDNWVLKPVARGYKKITPDVIQLGIGNFFGNLKEVSNTANDLLQWKWGQAANDSGRFLINSTLGLAGLFDVAAKAGLPRSEGEDFGQTLAVWGVKSGPYLMLPFLGPATLRDGLGRLADRHVNPVAYIDPNTAEYSVRAIDIIDSRAQLLETESLITGDSYTLLRDFYLQRRNYLIKDGVIEDDFGEGSFGDDYYYDE